MAAVEAITMTTNDPNINEAKVKPTSSISRIWIIPILVIVIGGWMVYYQWKNQGPLITIELHSATGIEVNKTPIKVRDLDIGQVKKITLKPDLNGVLVTARIDASAAHLLNENAKVLGCRPPYKFFRVSGLTPSCLAAILPCQPVIKAKSNSILRHLSAHRLRLLALQGCMLC